MNYITINTPKHTQDWINGINTPKHTQDWINGIDTPKHTQDWINRIDTPKQTQDWINIPRKVYTWVVLNENRPPSRNATRD